MKLSAQQVKIIKEQVAELFDPAAEVWLFGSRVDDNARGGDIDVFIERIFQTLERESFHLEGVVQRFFDGTESIDAAWLKNKLDTPNGIDVLESFGGKFARFQDTFSDRLLPVFLRSAGEKPGTLLENINQAERLGLIRDAQEWLGARRLRNKLVHEYLYDMNELAASLNTGKAIAEVLLTTYQAFRDYSKTRIGIELEGK